MSIIPKKGEQLDLYQGSTFDETWTFMDEDEVLIDLTNWKAGLTVRASYDGPPILELEDILDIGSPPDTDGLVLGGAAGTIRIYVTDESMAAITAAQFTATPNEDGGTDYTGVWDLELENPDGERFRYVMGPVVFSQEVTYGP